MLYMYLILIPKIAVLMFLNPIIGVMVHMLAYSAVDRALDPLSDQTIKIDFCCFFIKHTGLRRKG
jgi:hypothetical protein